MENSVNSVPLDIIKRNINHFSIGEETPYLYPFDNLIIKEDSLEIDNINISSYQFINFGKLIQVACSIGTASIFHTLKLKEKTFFLTEKCRIRKVSYGNIEGSLSVKAKTISISSKKGKSFVGVFDESGLLKYSLEQDCTILSENMFSGLFKAHECNEEDGEYTNTLPELKNIYIGDNSFRIVVAGFSKEQCQGHFPGFPIIPGPFLVNCILSGIKNWLLREEIVTSAVIVENCESFLNKAVPIRTMLHAKVNITKVQYKMYLFTTEIIDLEGTSYGFYLITIQIE